MASENPLSKVRLDLHSHSTSSDGVLTPTELVKQAALHKIEYMALTDHDTFSGVDEARAEASRQGIKFITGVEISAKFTGGTMHILAYGFDNHNQQFNDVLVRFIEYRSKRNALIIGKLQEFGFDITEQELFDSVPEATKVIGRPHIANLMIKKKLVSSFEEAFDKYIGYNKPAYMCKEFYEPDEILKFIHDAGGLSVLAHPITLHLEEAALFQQIKTMKDMGLRGVEIYNSSQDAAFVNALKGMASRLDLLVTAGSDYHGVKGSLNQLGRDATGNAITADKVSPEILALAT